MSIPAGLTTGTWTLDASHSEIGFTVRHAGISKTRGRFAKAEAELVVAEDLASSAITATIATDSFDSGDPKRDAHVRGTDFFDAEQFPAMTFAATAITPNGDDYILTGDLTIRGNTHAVDIQTEFNGVAVDPFGTTRAGFSALTSISRKSFGLTWNAALDAGGVMVGDKVTINLDLEFTAPLA